MSSHKELVREGFYRLRIEDGILFADFWPQLVITIEIAQSIVKDRIRLQAALEYPVCTDVRQLKSLDKASRDFFSSEDGGLRKVSAGALIVNSYLSKIISNFYLRLASPQKPARVFTDPREAKNWLKNYR